MTDQDLIPQLYRQEYSKMVSLLCYRFGMDQMDAAEDIVSETFLSAAESWGLKGVPENPVAWLYAVARNNALNGLRHEKVVRRHARRVADDAGGGFGSGGDSGSGRGGMDAGIEPDWDLSLEGIADSQLRMLFAVCHPSIPVEAQVSLALRVLCGFTVEEIAQALLTNKAAINKRLYRAKERLREEKVELEMPAGAEIDARLDAVLLTLYLLFNEGYYSASADAVLRKDLCLEAMRLCFLLAEREGATAGHAGAGAGGTGAMERGTAARTGGTGAMAGRAGAVRADVYALLALMCFQASRFEARFDDAGGLVLYEQQDSGRWDAELIERGNHFFMTACAHGLVSRYHYEAAIAWWHSHVVDSAEKWPAILMLYNKLLIAEYSPVAALNRAYAYYRVYGAAAAIAEAEALKMEGNLFYHSLLGELYNEVDAGSAVKHWERALELAGTDAEKNVLAGKLASVLGNRSPLP